MNPILQFGTSRFLQAHVDLFVSEALRAPDGQALGHVTVVQGSDSAASARRVAAFRQPGGFTVRIRGRQDGATVDEERRVTSVTEALSVHADWAAVVERVAGPVRVIISNTADQGYLPDAADHAGLLGSSVAPRGFPAKLLVLLHARFLRGAAPVTLLPCELVARNGDVLRGLVVGLARDWRLDAAFIAYLENGCVWVNSLVDRIVSEPLEPIGAVAEPYALWAIEVRPGMLLPCRHPDIVVTDDLERYASLKLYLLNLGHSWLAQRWLAAGSPDGMTVCQAMADPAWLAELDAVWEEEVLPVFAAMGQEAAARAYLGQVRERFMNPFLAHRLSDIAGNHAEKLRRRFAPVLALAGEYGLSLPQARLRAALQAQNSQAEGAHA